LLDRPYSMQHVNGVNDQTKLQIMSIKKENKAKETKLIANCQHNSTFKRGINTLV